MDLYQTSAAMGNILKYLTHLTGFEKAPIAIKILKNLAIVLAYVMMVLLAYRNGNIETVRLMNNKLSTIEDSAFR